MATETLHIGELRSKDSDKTLEGRDNLGLLMGVGGLSLR